MCCYILYWIRVLDGLRPHLTTNKNGITNGGTVLVLGNLFLAPWGEDARRAGEGPLVSCFLYCQRILKLSVCGNWDV